MARRTDDLLTQWARHGYVVTPTHLARAQARLDDAPKVDDQQHEENLHWLRQFDSDASSAAA